MSYAIPQTDRETLIAAVQSAERCASAAVAGQHADMNLLGAEMRAALWAAGADVEPAAGASPVGGQFGEIERSLRAAGMNQMADGIHELAKGARMIVDHLLGKLETLQAMPVEFAYPLGEQRRVTLLSEDLIEGERVLCIAIEDPVPAELPAAAEPMRAALEKIIEMNRQHAKDQYGDPNKAESWSCIVVARAALSAAPDRAPSDMGNPISNPAPSTDLSGNDAEQSRQIWQEAISQAAFYVTDHCKDGEYHAEAIMSMPLPKITMRAPSTDSATERDAARYRAVRTMSPQEFVSLFSRNLAGGFAFDDLVDQRCAAIAAMKGEG